MATRAQLAEDEKEELFKEIEARDEELSKQRHELRQLTRKINQEEVGENAADLLTNYMKNIMRHTSIAMNLSKPQPDRIMQRRFKEIIARENVHPQAIEEMVQLNLLDDEQNLTKRGISWVRSLARKFR